MSQWWHEVARIQVLDGRSVRRRTVHADPYCPRVRVLSRIDGPSGRVESDAAWCPCALAAARQTPRSA